MKVFSSKTSHAIRLLYRDPFELADRLTSKLEITFERFTIKKPIYENETYNSAVSRIDNLLGLRLEEFVNESQLLAIEGRVSSSMKSLIGQTTNLAIHNADFMVARLCYLLCRAVKPLSVLETGVALGVTSAFILQALEVNERGSLNSIDLPPLTRDAERSIGMLIPDNLRHRWVLHRGTSKKKMPKILEQLGDVDMFIHDSLHTHRNISRELALVEPHLTRSAVIICDDIEDSPAFQEWIARVNPVFSTSIKEEKDRSVFGVAILAQ